LRTISDIDFVKYVPIPREPGRTVPIYPGASYADHELPVRTLYDAVGWILSITAVPESNSHSGHPTQNNFYLPLVGLFGRWSSALLPAALLPAMLHVAYWTDVDTYRCILGSTVGTDQVMSLKRRVSGTI
jgi:hypothetical protein